MAEGEARSWSHPVESRERRRQLLSNSLNAIEGEGLVEEGVVVCQCSMCHAKAVADGDREQTLWIPLIVRVPLKHDHAEVGW